MKFIEEIKATSVRNLTDFHISPSSKLNYLFGENASGKTSVLETIYLLSRGKSFRSKRICNVITRGKTSLSIYATGRNAGSMFTLGIEKRYGYTRLRRNGESVNAASEQAKALPVLLHTPEYYRLFQEGPKFRRHWLDWSLFHVEPDYLDTWKSYHKALRHRNAILKHYGQSSENELSGWEKIMGDEAQKIDQDRLDYIQKLMSELLDNQLPKLLQGSYRICYENSVAGDNLIETLASQRGQDRQRGFTMQGPHRADILFETDGLAVAKHLSRGQSKLFGAALVSAQIQLLKQRKIFPVMLVDDIDSELDDTSYSEMLSLLKRNEVQTFITSLRRNETVCDAAGENILFHVKHGQVSVVN